MRSSRKAQSSAHRKVKIGAVGTYDDRRPRIRAERFFQSPKRILIGARLNHHEPARLNAELAEAMREGTAKFLQRALCGNQNGRSPTKPLRFNHQGERKSERGRPIGVGRRNDLVQETGCKATLRQVPMDFR